MAGSKDASNTFPYPGAIAGLIARHSVVGLIGALLTYLFWLSRPEWAAEMRFWRAVGDASLIFLYVTLALGPATRFLPLISMLLNWESGLEFSPSSTP